MSVCLNVPISLLVDCVNVYIAVQLNDDDDDDDDEDGLSRRLDGSLVTKGISVGATMRI